jgi:hypothetical protein
VFKSLKVTKENLDLFFTKDSPGHSNENHASMIATDVAYEDVCEAWWREVQQDAQARSTSWSIRFCSTIDWPSEC